MKHAYSIILCLTIVQAYASEPAATSKVPSSQDVAIRQATLNDFPSMWEIFHPIVEKGDTYVFDPKTTYQEAKAYYWSSQGLHNFVATQGDAIVGMYTLKANQPGLGSHVANASYMVHQSYQGRGIGSLMADHSIKKAKELGFKAMQFNMVVSTNTQAVNAWKKAGFTIVGTLPKVFNHQTLGYVDAYVMHRFLE